MPGKMSFIGVVKNSGLNENPAMVVRFEDGETGRRINVKLN